MMTVRFPDGTAIQYNTANYVTRHSEYSDLQEKKDGLWVAQIPNTAIIEIVPACRVYNAITDYRDTRLDLIEKELRSLKRHISAALKGKK